VRRGRSGVSNPMEPKGREATMQVETSRLSQENPTVSGRAPRSALAEALARARVARVARLRDQVGRGEYAIEPGLVAEVVIRRHAMLREASR